MDDIDEIKKLSRRTDQLQRSVDTLINERELLEDILGRLTAVENALHLNREHQTEVQKDIRADIREAQFATEDKIEKVLDEKMIIVKSNNKGLFNKLSKIFKKEVSEVKPI